MGSPRSGGRAVPRLSRALPRAGAASRGSERRARCLRRANSGCESGSQLTVMQTLSSQVHQGVLSCATEAGAAVPERTEPPRSVSRSACSGDAAELGAGRSSRTAAGATCHGTQSLGDGPCQQISQVSGPRMPSHASYQCLVLL